MRGNVKQFKSLSESGSRYLEPTEAIILPDYTPQHLEDVRRRLWLTDTTRARNRNLTHLTKIMPWDEFADYLQSYFYLIQEILKIGKDKMGFNARLSLPKLFKAMPSNLNVTFITDVMKEAGSIFHQVDGINLTREILKCEYHRTQDSGLVSEAEFVERMLFPENLEERKGIMIKFLLTLAMLFQYAFIVVSEHAQDTPTTEERRFLLHIRNLFDAINMFPTPVNLLEAAPVPSLFLQNFPKNFMYVYTDEIVVAEVARVFMEKANQRMGHSFQPVFEPVFLPPDYTSSQGFKNVPVVRPRPLKRTSVHLDEISGHSKHQRLEQTAGGELIESFYQPPEPTTTTPVSVVAGFLANLKKKPERPGTPESRKLGE